MAGKEAPAPYPRQFLPAIFLPARNCAGTVPATELPARNSMFYVRSRGVPTSSIINARKKVMREVSTYEFLHVAGKNVAGKKILRGLVCFLRMPAIFLPARKLSGIFLRTFEKMQTIDDDVVCRQR